MHHFYFSIAVLISFQECAFVSYYLLSLCSFRNVYLFCIYVCSVHYKMCLRFIYLLEINEDYV